MQRVIELATRCQLLWMLAGRSLAGRLKWQHAGPDPRAMKQAPCGTDSAVDRYFLIQVLSHRMHLIRRNIMRCNPSANERLGAGVKC